MKSRFIASLVAVGFVLATATGCNLATPQATTIEYSASDGVNVPGSGDGGLEVRNVLVVADRDGDEGNLIAYAVNNTDTDQTLAVDWGAGDATIPVPAGETVSLGDGVEPELLENLDAKPGSTVSMYIQPGAGDGVEIEVPVLNNCLTAYSTLAPNDEHDAEACTAVLEADTEH